MFNSIIGDLLNARSGVVEEEQEGSVAQRKAALAGQVAKEILDLVAFKESGFRWRPVLHGHGRRALADDEHFGCAPSDVLEQAMDGGQALVVRANVVPTLDFEMLEKADNPLEGEVTKREARDLAAPIGSDEVKQHTNGVAVAAHRGGTQTLDHDQVVGEERVQDWP